MDEGQARLQLEQRGVCLQEATVILLRNLSQNEKAESDKRIADLAKNQGKDRLERAFKEYGQACLNPPGPLPIRPKNRTHSQLKLYRQELVEKLQADCHKTFQNAIATLVPSAEASLETKKSIGILAAMLEKVEAASLKITDSAAPKIEQHEKRQARDGFED
jgi:hypothetical protein